MIDYGLLVSMIIAFGLPSLLGMWWQVSGRDGPVGFLDAALSPALAGLAVGRITTLLLDDPASIGRVSDMLIIRSGVEFWPGALAALVAVLVGSRLSRISPATRLLQIAPLAMFGYAGYEAACVFRDGCFGPASPIGLRPPGLPTTMLPVGLLMAVAVAAAAVGVRELATRNRSAVLIVAVTTLAVSSVRALGSIWLPHVGDGPTRQHLSSVIMVVVSTAVVGLATASSRRPRPKGAIQT